jgi:hypothetical protein
MVVANRLAGEQTLMLRVRGEEADTVAIDRQVVPRTDDGNLIYGFDISDQAAPVEIDVNTGTAVAAEWFRTRAGDRYRVSAAPSELQVELPDARVDLTLPVEAGEVGGGPSSPWRWPAGPTAPFTCSCWDWRSETNRCSWPAT